MQYYAHTDPRYPGLLPDDPDACWQALDEHLRNTAKLAEFFASKFDSGEWGRIAGLLHDLGKYRDDFQKRLRGAPIRAPHSMVGALLSFQADNQYGVPLAMVIAGHHGGLPNLASGESGSDLKRRIHDSSRILKECQNNIPEMFKKINLPLLPSWLQIGRDIGAESARQICIRMEMWIRFLFSCLVDADRIDTANHPIQINGRGEFDSVTGLQRRCDAFIDTIIENLSTEALASKVNQIRGKILANCRIAANENQGAFSLNVPTGGGKTLSGMSFALNHASQNNMDRVIVVIPYTSIIEQNAEVYSKCLGKENVLAHHSNIDPDAEKLEKGEELTYRHKLAAENWDAPVIVTTSVQFFETLFTDRTSKARKLHNVANSVIILDEVQTLPPGLLVPILDGLNQLIHFYHCSIVLSTATPPALVRRERFEEGLENVRPIIPNAHELASELERVQYHWPSDNDEPLELEKLADRLSAHDRVLCVVHRRRDARELAQILKNKTQEQVFHLSALMCPKHRLEKIKKIRSCLNKKGGVCRVVSTQLIEAGVDLDFPVVYRAMAGLDSIVQAAGRCNREGLQKQGHVHVFRYSSKPPGGTPQTAMSIMMGLLKEHGGNIKVSAPETCEEYFRKLYHSSNIDTANIQANRRAFNFRTVGRDFKMIEDGFSYTVIVPWGSGEERLQRLRKALENGWPTRDHLRSLQPYTVSIFENSFINLSKGGALEQHADMEQLGVYALNASTHRYLYDETYGLVEGDEPPMADISRLIL